MSKNYLSFLKSKKVLLIIAAVLVVGVFYYLFFANKNNGYETIIVKSGDFLQQVTVSGKIIATEDLNLSFEQSGSVKSVLVNSGDKVSKGKLMVSQDTFQLSSEAQEMQAGIDLQKAKLNQLLAGASDEDIKIVNDKVVSAKDDLENQYQSALITLNTSYNAIYNSYTLALYARNTYFSGNDEQSYAVQSAQNNLMSLMQEAKTNLEKANYGSQNDVDVAMDNVLLNLKNTYNYLKIIRDQCDQTSYYSKVTSTDKTSLDNQKININTASTSLISAIQNIDVYKASLSQAENQLSLKIAKPRATDIAVFEAQIKQAHAGLQNIYAQIRKKQIFSPINGVVTKVNAKTGSIFGPNELAVSLIGSGKFQIESYVPEIYISLIKIDNEANITLDSYGSGTIFKAKVILIDRAETIKDGVPTYKIKLEIEDDSKDIKTGMTANVVVTTEKKYDVISVPQGILKNRDGKKFIDVKDGDDIVEREVVLGNYSSSGQVEVISGLHEGDLVIISKK